MGTAKVSLTHLAVTLALEDCASSQIVYQYLVDEQEEVGRALLLLLAEQTEAALKTLAHDFAAVLGEAVNEQALECLEACKNLKALVG